MPPGRKPYDRNELDVSGTVNKMGPPTVDNEHLFRQNYAIRDFAKALKTTITLNDVSGTTVLPAEALKPAIKSTFFVKE